MSGRPAEACGEAGSVTGAGLEGLMGSIIERFRKRDGLQSPPNIVEMSSVYGPLQISKKKSKNSALGQGWLDASSHLQQPPSGIETLGRFFAVLQKK